MRYWQGVTNELYQRFENADMLKTATTSTLATKYQQAQREYEALKKTIIKCKSVTSYRKTIEAAERLTTKYFDTPYFHNFQYLKLFLYREFWNKYPSSSPTRYELVSQLETDLLVRPDKTYIKAELFCYCCLTKQFDKASQYIRLPIDETALCMCLGEILYFFQTKRLNASDSRKLCDLLTASLEAISLRHKAKELLIFRILVYMHCCGNIIDAYSFGLQVEKQMLQSDFASDFFDALASICVALSVDYHTDKSESIHRYADIALMSNEDQIIASAHSSKGIAYRIQNKKQESIKEHEKSVSICRNPETIYNFAYSLYCLNEPQSALSLIFEDLEAFEATDNLYTAALILLDLQRKDEALIYAKKAIDLIEGTITQVTYLKSEYNDTMMHGDTNAAHLKDLQVYLLTIRLLCELKQFNDAATYYSSAIERFPESTELQTFGIMLNEIRLSENQVQQTKEKANLEYESIKRIRYDFMNKYKTLIPAALEALISAEITYRLTKNQNIEFGHIVLEYGKAIELQLSHAVEEYFSGHYTPASFKSVVDSIDAEKIEPFYKDVGYYDEIRQLKNSGSHATLSTAERMREILFNLKVLDRMI